MLVSEGSLVVGHIHTPSQKLPLQLTVTKELHFEEIFVENSEWEYEGI